MFLIITIKISDATCCCILETGYASLFHNVDSGHDGRANSNFRGKTCPEPSFLRALEFSIFNNDTCT